ncbi:MAG: 16S rRNA (uracil(1498)-N(3))-methyltransferase [Chitinispirillia bacterium]|nr:16S rRNA (uracil(1498)-N(3))-methyltransferase [Chitinispirillia bacterium]
MNIVLLSESDFTGDNRAVITDRRLEHLYNVLNVKQGDTLKIGLVNGQMGIGTVECFNDKECVLAVDFNSTPPEALPCTLVIALPRPKTLKRSLEAAVAMGVKRIFIIGSYRVEKSYWSSPVLSSEYLHKLSILALEQSCDTILPEIHIRKLFRPFVEDELPLISRDAKAIIAHPYAPSFSMMVAAEDKQKVVLVIGPEGGFIPFEINLLEKQGCITVSFGSRILRVEQAVPAILSKLF